MYRIPKSNATPGFPSSKKIDFQTGYMKALNALAAAVTGSDIILLHSGVYGEITAHPMEAILDDDIAGMVGRFVEGVIVNNETIALELIEQVGPIPGHYLNTAHTRKWWKKEQYVPNAADELTYPEWLKTGKKDCLDYAKDKLEEILANHNVSKPLTPGQEENLGRILKEARDYYKKKGMMSDDEWSAYKEKVLDSPEYPFL
jgi:trimethylamine--corrinoid protein Co-methyltransferase